MSLFQTQYISGNLYTDYIDSNAATTISFGNLTATKVEIAKTAILTEIKGGLDVLQNLDVAGNVTVDGTVDGRDVALDGTNQDNHIANTGNPHSVTKTQVGLGLLNNIFSKYDATSPPTANDDISDTSGNGVFSVGSVWVDTTNDVNYTCVDSSTSAAVWKPSIGEINTSSSEGGTSLVLAKSGVNLPFKGLTATSTKIGLTVNANNIGIDVNQANITGTGILNSGSITSGFGAINNGSSSITTTGLITGGQLIIDQLGFNDGKITYSGTSTNNQIVIPDNLLDAFRITDGTQDYIKINSTTGTDLVEILQDLKITGDLTSTGRVFTIDGTNALPSYSFTLDTDTGIYRIGANNLGIATNGINVVDINNTRVEICADLDLCVGQKYKIDGNNIIINDLDDANITTPLTNQILEYNGSGWVNTTTRKRINLVNTALVQTGGAGVWVPITMEFERLKDANYTHATNSSEITINSTDSYYVSYTVAFFTSGNNKAYQARLELFDGSWAPVIYSNVYGICTNNNPTTIGTDVAMTITSGQKLRLSVSRISNSTFSSQEGANSIFVRRA
jgi:hypothetical protein